LLLGPVVAGDIRQTAGLMSLWSAEGESLPDSRQAIVAIATLFAQIRVLTREWE
jgi:hypothetical protein